VSGVYVGPLPSFALVLHCLQVSQSTSSPDLAALSFVVTIVLCLCDYALTVWRECRSEDDVPVLSEFLQCAGAFLAPGCQ
jgi:hypothetical protein